MQRMIEAVTARITAFLEQRQQLLLVVQGPATQSAIVLKVLETVDRSRARDCFWTFVEDFTGGVEFVSKVVAQFETRLEAVREAQMARGQQPWPTPPEAVRDALTPPIDRLRHLITFARSLIPFEDGQRLVWVMWPMRIEDTEGYAALLEALCRFDPASPWCHHVRLVVRDDLPVTPLARHLGRHPAVSWYAPDLSQPAMERALEAEANDPALPLERRMQSLVQLAALDQAHRRFPASFEKYDLLLHYYRQTANLSMTALCWNGRGEAHLMLDQARQAQECFARGIKVAIDGKAWPVLLNLTLNLANLKLKQRAWLEAATGYAGAEKLANSLLMLHTRVQVMENRGHCLAALGRTGEAIEVWEEAAALARQLSAPELLKPLLLLLKAHLPAPAPATKRRAIDLELSALENGSWSPPPGPGRPPGSSPPAPAPGSPAAIPGGGGAA